MADTHRPIISSSRSPRSYAFVIPRYFEGIAGGAETLMGALAERLAARGDRIEILATCARDNRTWENEFQPGTELVRGIPVHRFKVNGRDLEKWIPLQLSIHGGASVSPDAQLTWMEESVNSAGMYSHIAAHAAEYDALFFGPYLFGTTFWGSLIAPERSILIPCLHDEPYAYQEVIASMFRQVRGCLFNAAPERDLACELYGHISGGVVGMGFEPPPPQQVADLRPYFSEDFPYVLYLGRKETGKNVPLLIDSFYAAKAAGLIPHGVTLVVLGGGSFSDLNRPEALARGDVLDLPHVSEEEKQRLLAHALYLCQPSTNESFSIVLMEAWMVGTPVVVHGECAVTRHHVVESGAGLLFVDSDDLGGVTRYFLSHKEERAAFAARGRAYVEREYSWEAVLRRFDGVVAGLMRTDSSYAPLCNEKSAAGEPRL